MDWTFCMIWLLCRWVCECWGLPAPRAPMFGDVQSPQYPQPYPATLTQQWDLRVPEGYQIQLTFTHLDIEASANCYYDALTVLYDQKVLGRFCGQENSADGHHPGSLPISSPGNRLTLVFQSDDSNPELHQPIGFSAHYHAKDIDECSAPDPEDGSGPLCSQLCHNTLGSYLCSCRHGYELRPDQRTCVLSCGGGIFDEPEGFFTSPGYPKPSPLGVSCQYVISVELGFTVTLNFANDFQIESMDTEQGLSCLHHWLQLSLPDREPQKLCGRQSPGLRPTGSNNVRLDYRTDWAGLSRGWSLHYSTQRVQCVHPNAVNNGRITPVFTQYFYRDYIQVRCDLGYKLMMNGEEIKSYSSMCQSNGQWHLALPECQIIDCGEPKPLLNGGVTFISGTDNQYLSVIQYHCNEPYYSLRGGATVSYTCVADRQWRDNQDAVIPVCIPVCGKPKEISQFQRIMGGEAAPEGTIPWQVLLSVKGSRGGGMVIADRWVMTAAHNLVSNNRLLEKEEVLVRMGGNDAAEMSKVPPAAVSSLHPHPQYNNPNMVDFSHDIALIKLQQPITFHASILPICLPLENVTYTSGHLGLVSGFGVMRLSSDIDVLSNKLRYIRLPIVDQNTCHDSIDHEKRTNSEIPDFKSENMFCAGLPEGKKDSCQGDSGGPFALRKGDQYWAAGIISWGIKCGARGRYGVYTKVSTYIDWIQKTMQDN